MDYVGSDHCNRAKCEKYLLLVRNFRENPYDQPQNLRNDYTEKEPLLQYTIRYLMELVRRASGWRAIYDGRETAGEQQEFAASTADAPPQARNAASARRGPLPCAASVQCTAFLAILRATAVFSEDPVSQKKGTSVYSRIARFPLVISAGADSDVPSRLKRSARRFAASWWTARQETGRFQPLPRAFWSTRRRAPSAAPARRRASASFCQRLGATRMRAGVGARSRK